MLPVIFLFLNLCLGNKFHFEVFIDDFLNGCFKEKPVTIPDKSESVRMNNGVIHKECNNIIFQIVYLQRLKPGTVRNIGNIVIILHVFEDVAPTFLKHLFRVHKNLRINRILSKNGILLHGRNNTYIII